MSISTMSLNDTRPKATLRMPAGIELSSKCKPGEDIEIEVLQVRAAMPHKQICSDARHGYPQAYPPS